MCIKVTALAWGLFDFVSAVLIFVVIAVDTSSILNARFGHRCLEHGGRREWIQIVGVLAVQAVQMVRWSFFECFSN